MKRLTAVGLVLLILGLIIFIPAFSIKNGARYWEVFRMQRSIQTIEESKTLAATAYTLLDVDLNRLNLRIEEGDVAQPQLSYPVVADESDREHFELEITESGSELHIKELDSVERYRVFNRNFRIRGKTEVILTLPAGFPLETVNVDLSMGSSRFRQVSMDKLSLELSMGSANLNDLSAKDADIELSMGSLQLTNTELDSSRINLSMGSIEGSAILKGEHRLNCSMGSIELRLLQDPDKLNYNISTSMGSIRIDGVRHDSPARQTQAEAEADLEAGVSMGSVNLRFE